jgi:hypothetical protein
MTASFVPRSQYSEAAREEQDEGLGMNEGRDERIKRSVQSICDTRLFSARKSAIFHQPEQQLQLND